MRTTSGGDAGEANTACAVESRKDAGAASVISPRAAHRVALLFLWHARLPPAVQCVGRVCECVVGARTDCGRDSGERQSGGGDQLPLRRQLTARALLGVAGRCNNNKGHTRGSDNDMAV